MKLRPLNPNTLLLSSVLATLLNACSMEVPSGDPVTTSTQANAILVEDVPRPNASPEPQPDRTRVPSLPDPEAAERRRLAPQCRAHESACQRRCTDVMSDVSNCGGCGILCRSGEHCAGGQCWETRVDGRVRVTRYDRAGGLRSTRGCPPSLSLCDDACVDLSRSPRSCGSCDRRCESDERCRLGRCVGDSEPLSESEFRRPQ